MFAKIKDLYDDIVLDLNFRYATRLLKKLGYKDIEQDKLDKSIVFTFGQDRMAMLNMDHEVLGYSLEATVIYTADLMSLKTTSDMCNLIFMHRCGVSGLRPADNNRVKLNVTFHMGYTLNKDALSVGMTYLGKCLSILESYLVERVKLLNKSHYDLSMFENTDLANFNPQLLGEQREFVHTTWEAFSKAIMEEHGSTIDTASVTDMLNKIKACSEFETTNEVLISEVGNAVLDELRNARQMLEIAKRTYNVN